MTDNKTKKAEEKNESFDQFLKFRKANLDIQHIENLAQNGSPDEKNKANNEIRDLAYKLAKDVAPVSVGARTKEQFNDPNEIHGYMDALKVINQSNYSKFFD